MAANQQGYYGQNSPTSDTTEFNAHHFLVEQLKRLMNTATLVRVEKVTVSGQVGPVGTMSVTPMVKMIDGAGRVSDHGQIKNVIYARAQGGTKAIILDPKPGDLGLVVFCDRDTSVVRKTKKPSPPGSRRRFDAADGVYVMTVLGSTPTSYIEFQDDGTIVVSPDNGTTKVTVAAGKMTLDANGTVVVVKPGRVDLGQENAPNAVETTAGPSSIVFAVV